jgi:hypothetical protein
MNSKKLTVILSLVILTTFLLGACATAATPVAVATSAPIIQSAPTVEVATDAAAATASAPVAVALNTDYENAVSIEQQLILGIFKLEGTGQAISKEQAGFLLPLYSNLKVIIESMTPAQGTQGKPDSQPQAVNTETQAQIDTITKDILAALTPEQVKAISEMKITREVAQTIMTEKGISIGGRGQGGAMPGGNGQPPEGTPPAAGPNGSAGSPPTDGQKGQQPDGGMIPSKLVNALVELLQTK